MTLTIWDIIAVAFAAMAGTSFTLAVAFGCYAMCAGCGKAMNSEQGGRGYD